MEVVLLGSAATNVAILLIERYGKRPHKPAISSGAQAESSRTESGEGHQLSEQEIKSRPDQQTSGTEEPPEGSVPALEKKVKELRAEAKRVNSPDTFVQYARLCREANKIEREMMEKKALEPNNGDSTGIPELTRLLSSLVTPQATLSVKRRARLMALKMLLRALLFLSMWFYFSWYPTGESRGEVMTMDCRAFRPLSFMFRKRTPICIEEDWVCAAQPTQCVVSYTMALILANTVFPMILQAFN